MKNTFYFILFFICLNSNGIFAQNAPVSTVGAIFSYGTSAIVPITATGISDIGSCNLQLLYDPAIAICTAATKGPQMPGGYATNISTPGVITIGWYTWPGVTLPDNTVIFNLTFTKVASGTSPVTWSETYPDRQWSDGNSFVLNDLPFDDYYIDGSLAFLSNNAPITIAPDVVGVPGSMISIPVTVSGFNSIGSLALNLQYDDLVLTYQSFINDSGFPGLAIDGTTAGTIIASGYIAPGGSGSTLPDNATLFTLNFNYLGGSSFLNWFDNGTSCQYAGYPDYNVLVDSPTSTYYTNGSVSEAIRLGLTIFLEGAFYNDEMTTVLNDLDLIPFSQPYSGSPWNHNGLETATSIPNNAVDWVLVDLRETTGDASTAPPNKSIAKRAGFLMKDGSIKDINGSTDLEFPVSPDENLYIVVHHRNHISVISANSTTIVNGNGSYDFSSGELQVLGGSDGHKELITGTWGMPAGDSNADGIIDDSDKQDYWKPYAGTWGYISSDFSMDSEIDNKDKNDFWYLNYMFETQVPQ